jgi:hypothetical protein
MKCPYCDYTDQPDGDEEKELFYFLPIKLEQYQRWERERRANLIGCPECLKTFIKEDY